MRDRNDGDRIGRPIKLVLRGWISSISMTISSKFLRGGGHERQGAGGPAATPRGATGTARGPRRPLQPGQGGAGTAGRAKARHEPVPKRSTICTRWSPPLRRVCERSSAGSSRNPSQSVAQSCGWCRGTPMSYAAPPLRFVQSDGASSVSTPSSSRAFGHSPPRFRMNLASDRSTRPRWSVPGYTRGACAPKPRLPPWPVSRRSPHPLARRCATGSTDVVAASSTARSIAQCSFVRPVTKRPDATSSAGAPKARRTERSGAT